MTILFFDGFDWATTNLAFATKFDAIDGTAFNATHSRWPTGYGAYFFSYGEYAQKNLTNDTYNTITVGVSYYLVGVNWVYSSSRPWVSFRDKNGVTQVRVHADVTGAILVYNGAGTLLGTSSVCLAGYVWDHLQIKVYVHDSAGTVDIRHNDISVLSLSSKDTKYGTDYIDQIVLWGINYVPIRYDDFWITDGEFLGDCRIISYFPDSDETHQDFAPSSGPDHYAMVDEVPPDDDSTYNEASSLNAKDSYGVTPSLTGNVKAVGVNNFIRKTGNEGITVKNLIRSGGSDYNSTEEKALSTSYSNLFSIHTTDPDDSNPWTESKIDSAEFGLQITAITTTTTT